MKKSWKMGLFALAVAAGAVLGVTTGSKETAAAPCCSSCDYSYDRCVRSCAGDPDCELTCLDKWDACWGYCSSSC